MVHQVSEQVRLPIIQRKCGDCYACCEILSIEDEASKFIKPAAQLCHLIKDGKCSVYDTKPSVCTGFFCMWAVNHKAGMFNVNDRPDLSGILVVMNGIDADWVKYSGIPSFTAYETRPGAFKSYWGDKLLRKIAKKWLVIMMPWEARANKYSVEKVTEFRGPARLIAKLIQFRKLGDNLHGKGKERIVHP